MTTLSITSSLVAAFAASLVALSLPVSLRRIKVGIPTGDAADETLRRRIRAQCNFIEYVPIGLIALGLVEASLASAWLVLALGGTLAAGSALHAAGMLGGVTPLRGIGMILTYLMLLDSAARLAASAFP